MALIAAYLNAGVILVVTDDEVELHVLGCRLTN